MFEFTQSLFFWTLINFLVLVFLVHRFALPSFYQMVDEAEKKREHALSELEKSKAQANQLLAEYQSKMASVQAEVDEILREAKDKGAKLVKQELMVAEQDKQRLLSDVKREIDAEKNRFASGLQEEVLTLILSTARKVIGRELQQSDHDAIIKDDIEDFKQVLLNK